LTLALFVATLTVVEVSDERISDLRSSATSASSQIAPISKGGLILVQPGIQTVGWRSYGALDIWFDSYWAFPFNSETIDEYRSRYIKVCGLLLSSYCEWSGTDRLVEVFLDEESVSTLVLDKASSDLNLSMISGVTVTISNDFVILSK
jgi:hypothetical protein